MRTARTTRTLVAALAMTLCLALAAPGTAHADRYDSQRAGHPLRIVAYALHPVGVMLDYLIFRPGHWIGSHEPIRTLVGHPETPDEEPPTPHPIP